MSTTKSILLAAGVWCVVLVVHRFSSYGVYQLSKWGVCAAAIFGVCNVKSGWRFALAAVAVLFNPILPIHFVRDTWQILNGVAAAVFLVPVVRK